MKRGYTHITIILDRTGSMESIRDDAIGGFNSFLREQKALPGEATLTLVQFDSQDPYEVLQDFRSIADVPELTAATYVPRASTPLLDALGRGINDLAAKIANLPKDQRPEHTVFVVLTDGCENASLEFNRAQIVKMIRDCQEKAGWHFTFLSADLDAINDAAAYGIPLAAMLQFDKSGPGMHTAYRTTSARIRDLRSGRAKGVRYTDEDRKAQEELGKKKGN
jgi:Mg-chelatase subunit ChlD